MTAAKRAGVGFSTVRRIALSFPGVEEGPSYGTAGFRVRGKFMARMRDDETLVVKCGDEVRDLFMEVDPGTFFVTDHYRGYPAVLVRLARVREEALRDVLEAAWRRSAPTRLIAAHDGKKRRP